MDKVEWLEEVEALLRENPRKSEAQRAAFGRRARLLDAELESVHVDDPAVLEARAMLSYGARDFGGADATWLRLGHVAPDCADRAFLQAARCCLRTGDVDIAKLRLQAIRDPSGLGKRYEAVQMEIERRTCLVDSNREFDAARSALFAGDGKGYVTRAGLALERVRGDSALPPNTEDLLRELVAFVSNAPVSRDEEPLAVDSDAFCAGDEAAPAPLFCAGFGWSGSGAVFDFLCQSTECGQFSNQELALLKNSRASVADIIAVAGGGELRSALLERFRGVMSGLPRIRRGDADQAPDSFRIVVHDWLTSAVFGFGAPGDPASEQAKRRRRALHGALPDLEEATNWATLSFLRSLRQSIEAEGRHAQAFLESFSGYLSRLLRLRCGGRKFALFNNLIKGGGIKLLQTLPADAKAVVVFRDPADVYVDRISCGKQMPVTAFIRGWRVSMKRYHEALHDPGTAERVIPVRFEDFVCNEKTRVSLLERLGLDAGSMDGEPRFVQEHSLQNVGISDQFRDRGAVREISDALRDCAGYP